MRHRLALTMLALAMVAGPLAGPVAVSVRPVEAAIAAVRGVEPARCGAKGARVIRFRVEVERGLGKRAPTEAAFADALTEVLCDPRGWTRGGAVRFRHDPDARLRIALRSAASTRAHCLRLIGLDTMLRWSCAARHRGEVVLNADRWLGGSPWWDGPVRRYRRLLVNHEIGHILGFGHAGCAGRGAPAPVMMQQSKGTGGCEPNPWPLRREVARLR